MPGKLLNPMTPATEEEVDDRQDTHKEEGEDEHQNPEGSDSDEWEMTSAPSILTTKGVSRVFVIQETLRIIQSFRPSFLFSGHVVELREGESKPGPAPHNIVESSLSLSLRYEPPSPKFKRKCPERSSYRLKLSRGNDFLYCTRGLDSSVAIDRVSRVVTWGDLRLYFNDSSSLSAFVDALKYVKVLETPSGEDEKKIATPVERSQRSSKTTWRDSLTYAGLGVAAAAIAAFVVIHGRKLASR